MIRRRGAAGQKPRGIGAAGVCVGGFSCKSLFFLLWLLLDAAALPAGSQWFSCLFVAQLLCFFVGLGAGVVVLYVGASVLVVTVVRD